MDYVYFDTSALIKRYLEELRRREVLALLRGNQCIVSAVLPVEIPSALRRRVAGKRLDAKRAPGILKRLAADRVYWTIVEVSREVLATAEALTSAHPLGALDVIHVASAKLFADRRPRKRSCSSAQTCDRPTSLTRWGSRRGTSGLE